MENYPKPQQDLRIRPSDIVTIFVVMGSRSDEHKDLGIAIQVRREHFYLLRGGRCGWELKDIVIKALPQEFKYAVLNDWEVKVGPKGEFYCLYCSK